MAIPTATPSVHQAIEVNSPIIEGAVPDVDSGSRQPRNESANPAKAQRATSLYNAGVFPTGDDQRAPMDRRPEAIRVGLKKKDGIRKAIQWGLEEFEFYCRCAHLLTGGESYSASLGDIARAGGTVASKAVEALRDVVRRSPDQNNIKEATRQLALTADADDVVKEILTQADYSTRAKLLMIDSLHDISAKNMSDWLRQCIRTSQDTMVQTKVIKTLFLRPSNDEIARETLNEVLRNGTLDERLLIVMESKGAVQWGSSPDLQLLLTALGRFQPLPVRIEAAEHVAKVIYGHRNDGKLPPWSGEAISELQKFRQDFKGVTTLESSNGTNVLPAIDRLLEMGRNSS